MRREELRHAIAAELDSIRTGSPSSPSVKATTRRCPVASRSSASSRICASERERLGAVNLRADDELAEVRGAARQDGRPSATILTEAIKRLRTAIASLNGEGRERLLAAFDVVNEHFRELFTTLFEGGDGGTCS